MRSSSILAMLVALVLAACSTSDGGGAAEPSEAASPSGDADPSTTDGSASGPAARPPTSAQAALTVTYNSSGADFDAAEMGVSPGAVTAQWYQAAGFYVVVYEGLDLGESGPLCPGNSIQVASGAFEFVSNAPTEGADCSGFPTLTDDPDVGPLVCDGVVSYRTAIPAGTEGNLFGTLERPVSGGVMGMTGISSTSGGVPDVDLALLTC